MSVDEVLEGLKSYGIQYQPHSSDGLLTHLCGTYKILQRWKCADELCLAGLCHSVYGTESYERKTVPMSERPYLRSLIGEKAERLTYLFGAHVKESLWKNLQEPRESFSLQNRFTMRQEHISDQELNELITLTLANWLEQRPRASLEHQFLRKDEFVLSRSRLPKVAFEEFKILYGI